MRRFFTAWFLALVLAFPGSVNAGDLRLLMVEQAGCVYCVTFHREIAPAYDNTPEGKRAPLLRTDLRAPLPDGITLSRRATFTPTFVLLDASGQEISRIEGYPGEDFFWGFLGRMLEMADTAAAAQVD